jgi:4-amino-4-deoxy-L-arabinose transferase-like glycosyltransferase
MTMKNKVLFIILIVFALVIRTFNITKLPLYGDELTMVYDTYSISKTGMDSTGQRLPLTFRMGAGRPGGYIYFSVPFVAFFGPTVWGERALSILSGLGIIILMYFIGKKLFGEKVGVFAAVLMAISPWDIYLSRGGFEAHFALFLALLGITAFIYKKYVWWAIAWGITILTYPTFKLTLPILFLPLLWFGGYKNVIKNKFFVISLVILLFFGGLAIRENLVAGSEQRFLSQNIFVDTNIKEKIIQQVNYERTVSTLPKILKPIFINREIEYARITFENYIANISPDFLILRGDRNPRHNPGEMGMLYLIDLPLIIIGFVLLWKDKKKEFVLLLSWILITPLATMFFPETHALRNTLMLPPLILIASLTFSKIPKKFMYLTGVLIIFQLIYILVRIYSIAPAKFASFWSSEARKIAFEAIQSQNNGNKVVLSTKKIDNIEYAYEVYSKVDPNLVISQYGKLPKVYGNVIITD